MQDYATKQRRALLNYLQSHPDETLTAREIAAAMEREGISASAVYRNLAAQAAAGTIRRMPREGKGGTGFRYVGDACQEHLHLSCTACGKTFHVPAPLSASLVDEVARDTAFQVDRAGTVLYGVCAACRQK